MPTLYEVPLTTLEGKPTTLAEYAGKVLLIVNVASQCGFTPQYDGLEQLYQRYKDRGFVVLGFPANDFASQEPGTDADIARFCSNDYDISFPLFSKISVAGPTQHPIYGMLTSMMPQHEADSTEFRQNIDTFLSDVGLPPSLPLPNILWNFEKFLIGRDGNVAARFASDVRPDNPRLVEAIEKALG